MTSDLTRDVGWDARTAAGWAGVAQVAVDETWSATRLKPAGEIGRKNRRIDAAAGI